MHKWLKVDEWCRNRREGTNDDRQKSNGDLKI